MSWNANRLNEIEQEKTVHKALEPQTFMRQTKRHNSTNRASVDIFPVFLRTVLCNHARTTKHCIKSHFILYTWCFIGWKILTNEEEEKMYARTESARRLTCHLTETAHKFILTIECVVCAFVCHRRHALRHCVYRLNSPPSTTAMPSHDKIWNNAALNKVREERVDDVCRCESHFSTSHNPTDRPSVHTTLARDNEPKKNTRNTKPQWEKGKKKAAHNNEKNKLENKVRWRREAMY